MSYYKIELKTDQDDNTIIYISSEPSENVIKDIKDIINEIHEDEDWTYEDIKYSVRQYLKEQKLEILFEIPNVSFDMDSFQM